MSEENRAFVHELTLGLARRGPVVFMSTGIRADDHGDFDAPSHPNIMTLDDAMTPSDNLLMQSAVVSRAAHVYCTYGGFAYLPLLYGVPTSGFYSRDKHFMRLHGNAAYHLSHRMHTPLSVVHVGAFDFVRTPESASA